MSSTTIAAAASVSASAGAGLLVDVSEAIRRHQDSTDDTIFVDGTWYLDPARNGRDAYESGPRIPGARYWDINEICSTTTKLPHMLPSPALQAAAMDALGISNDTPLVVYGQADCPFAFRTWFQLITFGHTASVQVLDGSLDDWVGEGGPVDATPAKALSQDELAKDNTKPSYATRQPPNVYSLDQMRAVVSTGNTTTQIVDVRSADRFYGRVSEPRAGLRRGHHPTATNLPFLDLLQPDNHNRLKSESELREILEKAGLHVGKEHDIVATCGSGASACVLVAALAVVGTKHRVNVYDGSWAEWGDRDDTPIVTRDE